MRRGRTDSGPGELAGIHDALRAAGPAAGAGHDRRRPAALTPPISRRRPKADMPDINDTPRQAGATRAPGGRGEER
ncbi:hypothetical protein GCM10010219_03040 [Streptomyces netropsis]|nr:hypothetical protein GCM10010219_03040 [Streptomyces netropsis]